jgi:DNA-binding LacI/PurR family transcriptional regulator
MAPRIKNREQLEPDRAHRPIRLKELAEYLELSPATVSVVLNNVPGRSIPEATRQRIRDAAVKFDYRPSALARSLSRQQTLTIGVLLPEVGDGYHSQVLGGVADELERQGYSYLIAQHRHLPDRVHEYTKMLLSRGAEGLIAVDTHLTRSPHIPVVAVAGHKVMTDVTNVVLDHNRAAILTMQHLHGLGHREIGFIRGQSSSSDSQIRWHSTQDAAKQFGLRLAKDLIVQLEGNVTSPEITYPLVKRLLGLSHRCTAIVCFNDVAAIGAIRAVRDVGLQVPQDISIVGFDDIRMAAFSNPSITTVRQPLQEMGETAARILVDRIAKRKSFPAEVALEPKFIVRESTAAVRERGVSRKPL